MAAAEKFVRWLVEGVVLTALAIILEHIFSFEAAVFTFVFGGLLLAVLHNWDTLGTWARGNLKMSVAAFVLIPAIVGLALWLLLIKKGSAPRPREAPAESATTTTQPHQPTASEIAEELAKHLPRSKDVEKERQENIPTRAKVEVNVIRAIKKTDTFTTLVPINTAAPKMPVPQDENFDDPHRDFYFDLIGISGVPDNAVEAKWPVHEPRKIGTEGERFNFVTRLIQFYVLQQIQLLHLGSSGGMKVTLGEGATPLNRKAIPPPDSTNYPPRKLLEMLAGNEFLTPSARSMFERTPFTVPVGTTISLLEIGADPKEGKLFTCIVRLESPSHYTLELSIQPSGASGRGMPPAKFQTQTGATVQSYTIVVTMNAEITRTKTDDFDPDEYVAWTTGLFAGLEKKMGF
ncbi:MAG: hypothetical protein LAN37_13500 [Acidobacteriia bacterium]|nr:hypothetical protein [Terriglobia bacterium]